MLFDPLQMYVQWVRTAINCASITGGMMKSILTLYLIMEMNRMNERYFKSLEGELSSGRPGSPLRYHAKQRIQHFHVIKDVLSVG